MNDGKRIGSGADAGEHETLASSTLTGLLRQLLWPDEAFGRKKFEDHRRCTAVVLGILAVFLPLLWVWDYVTDPIGARDTAGLCLMFLLLVPVAVGFWTGKARRGFLEAAMPLALLASEGMFLEILNRLDTGMVYGLAGFMYCMYIAILIGQCLPLVKSIAYMLAAAALPQLMAAMSFAPGFSQAHYGVLLWPAAGLAILSQIVFSVEYLKRYLLEGKLKQLSDTDPLSGVGNRRYFMRMLKQEVARARRMPQPLSLLVLDIDHFKRINDTHGHLFGDSVICRLADLCGTSVRDIDVVARIGGEEFAILLIGSDITRAAEAAERIRARVESSTVPGDGDISVSFTVSIGVAQLQPADTTDLGFFDRADAALYAAKGGGRNRVMRG